LISDVNSYFEKVLIFKNWNMSALHFRIKFSNGESFNIVRQKGGYAAPDIIF